MRQARGRGGAARAGGRGAAPVSRASSTVASRDVTFKNSRGQVLVATLVDSEASGVVVLCHGFASTRNDFNYPAMAAALKARQLGSLRLDFSGNGQSQGTFSYGNYLQEVDDIRAAVNWLKAEGKEVVGLVGHSKAGNNVLIYSAMYDDVPYVVNIAGRFDVSGGIKERFGSDIHERLAREQSITIEQKAANGDEFTWELTKWSMEDRLKIDMKSYCERIKLAEVLTVHGTADTVVSPAEAQQFAKLIGTHELFMVQGAGHSFTDAAHAEALIQKVVSFVSG